MAADDLSASGAARAFWRRRFGGITILGCLVGLAGVVAVFAIGWIIVVDDPFGGEPVAIVALERPATVRADSGQEIGIRPTVDSKQVEPLPSGHSLPPADIVISDPTVGAQPAAAQTAIGAYSLSETSKHGRLPVITADGRRPSERYARATPALSSNAPRIAILVDGMGLSTTATEAAIDKLPPDVTLAFAPYGDEIGRLTDRARQAGHELVLQIPLEPYDYPDNDPGPHTLLTGLSESQNRDRLHWVMSRFSGYVGVLNYMGARFTSSDESLRPVLGELRDRGLIYVDDGTAPRSLAASLSGEVGLSFAKADLVIDSVPTKSAIRDKLIRLEEIARDTGLATGVASGLPISIEAIADWARQLEANGITLVPATAVVTGGQT